MRIVSTLLRRLRKRFYTPEQWARYIGVTIGRNNLIGKDIIAPKP